MREFRDYVRVLYVRMLKAKSISSLHRVYVYTWAAKPCRKIRRRRDASPISIVDVPYRIAIASGADCITRINGDS